MDAHSGRIGRANIDQDFFYVLHMYNPNRIVITGIGVVAPNGIGKEQFWENCRAGVSGIKPITLFDTSEFRCHWAGEVSDFQPEAYLGSKGLRNLDRTTLLAMAAAKLAIDDARLEITDSNRSDIGVVLGSTMGSVKSISDFDVEGLRAGPRCVNPACFPNTVINSPASHVAIRLGLKGLNSTISTGFTAGIDACGYALDMLQLERARILIAGGVEELCIQTFLGFNKLRLLSPLENAKGTGRTILGEGSAFLVLESEASARSRGATVYGEIVAYSSQFNPGSMRQYDFAGQGLSLAIREALNVGKCLPIDVDCLSRASNGIRYVEEMEESALITVLGGRSALLETCAIKSLIGESFSAAGALQIACGIGMRSNLPIAPSVIEVDSMAGRTGSPIGSMWSPVLLVTGCSPWGVSSAVLIR